MARGLDNNSISLRKAKAKDDNKNMNEWLTHHSCTPRYERMSSDYTLERKLKTSVDKFNTLKLKGELTSSEKEKIQELELDVIQLMDDMKSAKIFRHRDAFVFLCDEWIDLVSNQPGKILDAGFPELFWWTFDEKDEKKLEVYFAVDFEHRVQKGEYNPQASCSLTYLKDPYHIDRECKYDLNISLLTNEMLTQYDENHAEAARQFGLAWLRSWREQLLEGPEYVLSFDIDDFF